MESQIYFTSIFIILCGLSHLTQGYPVLMFADRAKIYLLNVSNTNTKSDAIALSDDLNYDAIFIDYWYSQKFVFWTDSNKQKIARATIGQSLSNITALITGLISAEGLACDWLTGNLYWGDVETHRIEVSNMDGGHRKVLFWENVDKPRAIALDPLNGYIYWTDWGEVPKIERASMDGSENSRSVIVDDNIHSPNGLTIDYQQHKLYWADAKKDSIFSSDMSGDHRQTILRDHDFLKHPFSLTVFNGTLFWTDWKTNSIISCKDTGQKTKRVLNGPRKQPMDIKVYDHSRQPQGSKPNPCKLNNGGCSHLCLTSSVDPYYTCACPTGILLFEDKVTCAEEPTAMLIVAQRSDIRYISLDTPDFTDVVVPLENVSHAIAIDYDPVDEFVYWTDNKGQNIRRAFLNGSGNDVIVNTDIDNPDGLVIDWIGRNLYWTDTGLNRIEVARLDGSIRKVIVSDGLDEPRAICLDPAKGYMWWTDWGSVPKIERAYLDGTNREVIIDKDVAWINGITIDRETNMLYWCDAKLDKIEVANSDGSNRRVLVQDDLPHAFGLSLLGNFIYWTDWQSRNIQRVDKGTGGNRSVIIYQMPDLMGLTAIYRQHINLKGWNRCANNNGGCSHLCLHTPTWTKCACPVGMELDSIERNCIVIESYMLFSQRSNINMVTFSPIPTIEQIHLSRPGVNPYNIDVHIVHTGGREMYWTDKENKNICRAFVSGSSTQTIVKEGLDVPEDLAVDWIGDNLYWIDAGNQPRIEVSRLDGTHRKVLIWKDLKQPRSIAVNPINGYMYWTDGSNIERAHLDGSNRHTILTKSGKASDLIIDYTDQRIYWINNRHKIIESADLMGMDRRQVVVDEIYAPVSLALFEGYLYWVDEQNNTMEKSLKTNGTDRVTVSPMFNKVKDIVFFDSSRLTETNACSTKNGIMNGGCSDLCFVSPDILKTYTTHKCSCPYNSILSDDGISCNGRTSSFLLLSKRTAISELIVKREEDIDFEIISDIKDSENVLPIPVQNSHALDFDPWTEYVYWIAGHKRAIRRSRMDGSEESTIVHDANSRPFDIVVDPFSTLLFWSCSKKNVINTVRMDNLKINGVIIQEKSQKPRYLAVNPKTGHIFWTNNGHKPSIRTSLFDGTDIVTLVSTELYKPGPIAVDPKSDMLYWVNKGQMIEAIGISGENRRILYRGDDDGVANIVGLSTFNELLFFLDKGNLQIRIINQTSGNERPVIRYNNRYINDISATIDLEVSEHNPCDSVNLNCSHICIRNGSSALCACPLNLDLLSDLKTCKERLSCSSDQFTCKSGEILCIPKEWSCDGLSECSDASDEEDCESCPLGYFQCNKDMKCIRKQLVCDGEKNCIDGEDEIGCCGPAQNNCQTTAQCYDDDQRCDGISQCDNGEDELDCCGKHKNKCMTTPQCFDDEQRCDGIAHCDYGEDELGCCGPTQIRCLITNQCYDKTQRCDGSFDCYDKSDEYNC